MTPLEWLHVRSNGFRGAVQCRFLTHRSHYPNGGASYQKPAGHRSRQQGNEFHTFRVFLGSGDVRNSHANWKQTRDVGVCGVWMPCRHALGFVVETDGNEFQSELMRADPYLAPHRGTQVTLSRNFSSPRSPPSRRLALIADSEPEPLSERITSRPTFGKLIRVVLLRDWHRTETRAVFPVDKQNQRGTPPSHTLQFCYLICPTPSGLTTLSNLSSFDHTADTGSFMLWGT